MYILFCQTAVSKPVEKEAKMEGSESPASLPKGSYNFDFDSLDENVNPFQTRSKVIIQLSSLLRFHVALRESGSAICKLERSILICTKAFYLCESKEDLSIAQIFRNCFTQLWKRKYIVRMAYCKNKIMDTHIFRWAMMDLCRLHKAMLTLSMAI